ncbi:MAG: DUF2225 domain-containing protein [Candidatus Poribacteria bacterium]|nr:DUF2225 domain-containing protein [Candidatus Poribacteria bacterium]
MSVLIRILIGSVVGVLTVGLSGCGCLYPFTPQSPNLYADVYKANDLRYSRKYTESIAEYEQALKKLPRSPTDTKVMNVSFPTFLKYHIAFCYAKLAEANGDVSLYVKAETAVRESYETAVLPPDQADVLYLWGYILFKQGRYTEALSKFEQLIDVAPQSGFRGRFLEDALYALGKTYLELGDAAAAGQILAQLETMIHGTDSYFYTAGVMCALGKTYLELGDESAARRVFAQLAELLKITVEGNHLGWDADGIYAKIPYDLGKAYLELGEEATAQRIFSQLEVLLKIALQREYVGPDAEEIYAEVVYGLGKVYLELGEEAAAQRMFAMLLEHYSDSPHKVEVERLLEKQ